jgi:CRP-like cAMP-binding protein
LTVGGNIHEEAFRTLRAGDFIGGLSLLCSRERLFSLKAEFQVKCLMLSREKFQRTLERYLDIAGKVTEAAIEGVWLWEQRFTKGPASSCPECKGQLEVTLI